MFSPLVPYFVYVTCVWEEADQGILVLIPDALGRQWTHHLSPVEHVCKARALNIDADVSTPYFPLNPLDIKQM